MSETTKGADADLIFEALRTAWGIGGALGDSPPDRLYEMAAELHDSLFPSEPRGETDNGADGGEDEGARELTLDELLAEYAVGRAKDDWLPNGCLRCNLCGREPCRCGVPRLFAEAYDRLAHLTLERLRARPESREGADG